MRACEGCRRRKIKCDAATTNAWPCAACIRLKLNCVPPTVSYDKDYTPGSNTFEIERPQEYENPAVSGQDDYQRHHSIHHLPAEMAPAVPPGIPATYADGMRMYQTAPYIDPQTHQEHLQYPPMPQPSVVGQELNYQTHPMYSGAPAPPLNTSSSDGSWKNESSSDLADALGELKIDHTAVGKILN